MALVGECPGVKALGGIWVRKSGFWILDETEKKMRKKIQMLSISLSRRQQPARASTSIVCYDDDGALDVIELLYDSEQPHNAGNINALQCPHPTYLNMWNEQTTLLVKALMDMPISQYLSSIGMINTTIPRRTYYSSMLGPLGKPYSNKNGFANYKAAWCKEHPALKHIWDRIFVTKLFTPIGSRVNAAKSKEEGQFRFKVRSVREKNMGEQLEKYEPVHSSAGTLHLLLSSFNYTDRVFVSLDRRLEHHARTELDQICRLEVKCFAQSVISAAADAARSQGDGADDFKSTLLKHIEFLEPVYGWDQCASSFTSVMEKVSRNCLSQSIPALKEYSKVLAAKIKDRLSWIKVKRNKNLDLFHNSNVRTLSVF
jgi:hypothetical protein